MASREGVLAAISRVSTEAVDPQVRVGLRRRACDLAVELRRLHVEGRGALQALRERKVQEPSCSLLEVQSEVMSALDSELEALNADLCGVSEEGLLAELSRALAQGQEVDQLMSELKVLERAAEAEVLQWRAKDPVPALDSLEECLSTLQALYGAGAAGQMADNSDLPSALGDMLRDVLAFK
jgi:hypothetical protein